MSETAAQENIKPAANTTSEVINGKSDAVKVTKEPAVEVATSEIVDEAGKEEKPVSNGNTEESSGPSEETNADASEKEVKAEDDKMDVEQVAVPDSSSNNTAPDEIVNTEQDTKDEKKEIDEESKDNTTEKKEIVEESKNSVTEKKDSEQETTNSLEADKENKEEADKNGEKDEEEEDESSDEELPPGLLERPVEIYNEKRQRKKVTRFIPDEVSTPSPSKKVVEIKVGAGVKLSSQPRVCWQLNKNKIADLKLVHKLLYGVWGEQKSIKSNILQFSGFTFEKDSKEYEKKEEYIGGFTMDNLKWLMDCCDVTAKGNKDDKLEALMNWCMCPKPSGKETPNAKKKKTPKKKATESSSAEGEAEEGESPAKKATKRKSTSKATVKINSPSSAKKAKKTPNSTPNKPPTNAQIVKCVKKILDGANLEEITMKGVCVQVYAQYPQFDLSSKKAFIKDTVRKVIS